MSIRLIGKAVAACVLVSVLTGCGCVVDPGDSSSPDDYVTGCWSAAKRDER